MLRSPFSGIVDALASTLLPISCSVCGAPQPHLSSAPICSACWQEVQAQSGTHCARCADDLDASISPPAAPPAAPSVAQPALCRYCRLAPPPFQRAVAFGPYVGRMRGIIFAFKYQGLRPAATGLGNRLAQAIATLAPNAPAEMLVVPIPLHRSKFRRRGFNQSQLLAAQALRRLRRTHPAWRLTLAPGLLQRRRATLSQAGLSWHQRRTNVLDAFTVARPSIVPSVVKDRAILLVDDIVTTGATARSAARALLNAGASSVFVAALARAGRFAPDFVANAELLNLHPYPPDAPPGKPNLLPIRL
ncbi:MAG TPA: ComF family protein [Terracidiphilus sp.]|nr:ComF family protein [Terracidiphilus sp.]